MKVIFSLEKKIYDIRSPDSNDFTSAVQENVGYFGISEIGLDDVGLLFLLKVVHLHLLSLQFSFIATARRVVERGCKKTRF